MSRLIVFFFLLLSLVGASSTAAMLSRNDSQRVLEGSEISIYRDSSAIFDIDTVSSIAFAGKFQPIDQRFIRGYTTDIVWLKLTLQRDSQAPADWLLELTNPFINDLRLYSPVGLGFAVEQAGDRFPFSQREVSYHHPVFRINLSDSSAKTFYLRIESDSSISAQLLLWKPAVLRDVGQEKMILFGGVMGMVLMSVLISLIHWGNSRDPSLLYFLCLSINIFLFLPAQLGLLSQFVFQDKPSISDFLVPWTLAITTAAVPLVFWRALGVAHGFPRLALLIRFTTVLCLLAPLTREFELYSLVGGPALQVLFIGGMSVTGWMSWCRWRQHLEGAGYFLAAHVILISSILTGRLMLLGIVPANALTYLSWIPGILTFLLLVHAGIVIDVRVALRDRAARKEDAEIAREIARQEMQLRREQTVFFSFVAHELRTPLGIIVTGLKNLRRDLANANEKHENRINRLMRAVQRMGILVERHLNFQRLACADFSPRFAAVSPTKPALDALMDIRETYSPRLFEMTLMTDLPPTVRLDAELVMLAISNLLSNAAKYSSGATSVYLEIGIDTLLRYRIIDHGPGIPRQERERLFRVFERSPTADGATGFGIGLAIAQRVAVIHQGSLAYSDGAEGGAIFTLSIPLDQTIDGVHS